MTARRLTPLSLMVLALLDEDDMHPYEMLRLMKQRHDDRMLSVTNGTMYHTVARLQRDGLIAEVGVDREGNRPERTTYTLLPSGGDAMRSWLRDELERIDRPGDFRIALSEAHNLPRDEVRDLLTRRLARLTHDLAELEESLAAARRVPVDEQFLVEDDRERALCVAETIWLADFLGRLQNPQLPWGHAAAGKKSDHYLAQRKAARE